MSSFKLSGAVVLVEGAGKRELNGAYLPAAFLWNGKRYWHHTAESGFVCFLRNDGKYYAITTKRPGGMETLHARQCAENDSTVPSSRGWEAPVLIGPPSFERQRGWKSADLAVQVFMESEIAAVVGMYGSLIEERALSPCAVRHMIGWFLGEEAEAAILAQLEQLSELCASSGYDAWAAAAREVHAAGQAAPRTEDEEKVDICAGAPKRQKCEVGDAWLQQHQERDRQRQERQQRATQEANDALLAAKLERFCDRPMRGCGHLNPPGAVQCGTCFQIACQRCPRVNPHDHEICAGCFGSLVPWIQTNE